MNDILPRSIPSGFPRRHPLIVSMRNPMPMTIETEDEGFDKPRVHKVGLKMTHITIPVRADGKVPANYSPGELEIVLSFIRNVETGDGTVLTPDLLLPWDVPQGIADSFKAAAARLWELDAAA